MKILLTPLLLMAAFVVSIVIFNNCNNKNNTDKVEGMLEQCQKDFDEVLKHCYGENNGNN